MVPLYQQKLASLREAFPAPVSDPVHDGYVVFSLLRTLDRVDALKSQAPLLGPPRELDYAAAASVAGWLGIGHDNVIRVPSLRDNSIDVAACESIAREQAAAGKAIAAIIATMGTTDAFGVDDLAGLFAMRDRLVDELKLPYR